jgi:hypothetical protein
MKNYNALADAYAQLDAEYKLLKKRLEQKKAEIIGLGEGEFIGEYYTVAYKKSQPVKTFDADLAAQRMADLGLNDLEIQSVFNCKKEGKCQDRITISATAMSIQDAA